MIYHRGYWKVRYEGELLKSTSREELEKMLESKTGEAPVPSDVQRSETPKSNEEETWTNYTS